MVKGERLLGSFSVLRRVYWEISFSFPVCVWVLDVIFFSIGYGTVCLIQCDVSRCVNLVTSQTKSYKKIGSCRGSHGIGIHAIAKDQWTLCQRNAPFT